MTQTICRLSALAAEKRTHEEGCGWRVRERKKVSERVNEKERERDRDMERNRPWLRQLTLCCFGNVS